MDFVLSFGMGMFYAVCKFQLTEHGMRGVMLGYMMLDMIALYFGLTILLDFLPYSPVTNFLFLVAVHSSASAILTCITVPIERRADFDISNEKVELGYEVDEEKGNTCNTAR